MAGIMSDYTHMKMGGFSEILGTNADNIGYKSTYICMGYKISGHI
jgi:hypothetical protein